MIVQTRPVLLLNILENWQTLSRPGSETKTQSGATKPTDGTTKINKPICAPKRTNNKGS
jgi:hypothetical protein